jgi:hypothetical protein
LEYNDYGNESRAAAYRQACDDENIIFTIWLTRDFTAAQVRQAIMESGCDGVLLEGEIAAMHSDGQGGEVPNPQAVNWPEVIAMTEDLDVSKGVITNFSPFQHADGTPFKEKATPLIQAGWKCIPELYDRFGDPATWADNSDWYAKTHYNWPETQPAIGVFSGRTFESFGDLSKYRNWSVWAAEYLI